MYRFWQGASLGRGPRRRSRSRDPNAPKPPKPVSKGFGNWQLKKKNARQGIQVAQKLPTIPKFPETKEKVLKLNRVKDWMLMEEELLKRMDVKETNTESIIDQAKLNPAQRKFVERLRGLYQLLSYNKSNGTHETICNQDHR